jgi:hypothetical protein
MMKKVKAVARRKSALVFLLLCMMVLILSPWADAPSPYSPIVTMPEGEAFETAEPVIAQEVSDLTVEVALEESEFSTLIDQNEAFVRRHPDITVTLLRTDPQQAYSAFKRASQMEESADVMLLSTDWVKEFASSGYLLPADAAFIGKALAEQFDALSAPLKWNGYLWGVPLNMDPFVLVWNTDLLQEWLGEDVVLPLTIEQWTALAEHSTQLDDEASVSWLTLDRNDPLALLAWLEIASSERSDGLWVKESQPWEGTIFEQGLGLLDLHRTGVDFTMDEGEYEHLLKEKQTVAAIVPYSLAAALVNGPRLVDEPKLEIDHLSWKLPYIWPRGSSYSISSHTEVAEAAHTWISEMTDVSIQLQNYEELNRLPVYRSLYDSDRQLSNLLPGRSGQAFPNQAPLAMGPELPARLDRLQALWIKLAAAEITLEDWKKQWAELFADL